MAGPHRLLVIGIDGADYYTLTDWIARGKLPNLAELLSHGQLLRCESTRPPLTAPAWTTIFTGCNPGKHGRYDFMDFSFPRRRAWWTSPGSCPDLFERLSAASLSCGGLNVPMIYPAREAHGIMVSGFGAPESATDTFYPPSLRDELLAVVPDYAVYPRWACYVGDDPELLCESARGLGRAAAHLLGSYELDVFAVVFGSLDWAAHAHACQVNRFDGIPLQVAAVIDEEIGRLVERTKWPKTPVLIMSDHGMRLAQRQVNLPKLFVDLGLMQVRGAGDVPPIRRLGTSALISGWRLAKRVLPPGLIRGLRIAGDAARREITEGGGSVRIDWERTTAFPLGAHGSIRLSVRGREPEGRVAPEDYERVRAHVIGKLQSVTDPDSGEPVFAEVLCREELYSGARISDAPDIVVSPQAADMALGIPSQESHLMLFTQQQALIEPLRPAWGVHSPDAVLGISGDGADRRTAARECSLVDFAPTVLHLLGLPVPSSMDGRVLSECLTAPFGQQTPVVLEDDLVAANVSPLADSGDDEVLVGRLRDLGYL